MNFEEVLKFSFSWIKNRESLKYAGYQYVLIIGFLVIIGVLFLAFFAEAIDMFLKGVAPSEQVLLSLSPNIIGFVAIMLVLTIFASIVSYYIFGLMFGFALRQKRLVFEPFPFRKGFRMFLLQNIVEVIYVFFYPPSRKLLVIQWAIILAMLASFLLVLISPAVVILLLFTIPAYIFIIGFNLMRFSMAIPIFLSTKKSISQSLRASWELTRGNALNVFLMQMIVGFATTIIYYILAFIIMIIPIFALGLSESFVEIVVVIIQLVLLPFSTLVYAFLFTGIYSELKK